MKLLEKFKYFEGLDLKYYTIFCHFTTCFRCNRRAGHSKSFQNISVKSLLKLIVSIWLFSCN